uniref:DUF4939 domain-containing protein n=1 Tax=Chrysemys picta bellii TaxID=8478 RepID=A0A8C3HPC8_CHRPI
CSSLGPSPAIALAQPCQGWAQGWNKPKIPLPDKCNSNCDKFQGFLNQCHLLFLLRPQSFPTDQSRVRLIISLLTGEALAWASPFLEKASSLLGHFTGTVCVGDGIAGGDFT